MKKVMIISYYYPPNSQIGGVRPYGLAKYLPDYDWETIVLTPGSGDRHYEQTRIVETDYIDILKTWKKRLGLNPDVSMNAQAKINPSKGGLTIFDYIFAILKNIILFPDPQIGWYTHAVKAGENILAEEQVSAIISTSQPATCHLIAKTLSEEYDIPWIADYRDLWSQDFYKSGLDSFIGKLRGIERFERDVLSGAEAITTVSTPLADSLISLHEDKPVYIIPNGFDLDDVAPPCTPLTKKFTVTYTGNLYRGKRDPDDLLKVFSELILAGKVDQHEVTIQFFCPIEDWLLDTVSLYQLDDIVTFHGMIPKPDVVERQRESQVLLLLLWNHPEESGVFTGKIFEYLAAKRPILCVNGPEDGVVKQLLAETNAGTYCASPENIKDSLFAYYQEYRALGHTQYHGIDTVIDKYSHREMAKRFDEVLSSIIG